MPYKYKFKRLLHNRLHQLLPPPLSLLSFFDELYFTLAPMIRKPLDNQSKHSRCSSIICRNQFRNNWGVLWLWWWTPGKPHNFTDHPANKQ